MTNTDPPREHGPAHHRTVPPAHSRGDTKPVHHEVPTLPAPSRWRLVAAAVVTVAFLYFMYQSYDEEPDLPVPAKSGLAVGNG